MRGDIHELKAPRNSRDHEQQGRYAVVLQSERLQLSTWLVAPTSRSARPTGFRPDIELGGDTTLVLVEQIAAVSPDRLGRMVGRVSRAEFDAIDDAVRIAFDLDR